jgi:Protein of unknown function (DUF3225)
MKQWLILMFVVVASSGSVFAQQPSAPKAGIEIDLPEVIAEVRAAYDRYNSAINSGTIAVLNDTFWNDPRTIRDGQAENLYGHKEIAGFRTNARPLDPPRTLSRTVITQPGKVGRQMQTWVRFPDGWHVVAAEVSTIDEPK